MSKPPLNLPDNADSTALIKLKTQRITLTSRPVMLNEYLNQFQLMLNTVSN